MIENPNVICNDCAYCKQNKELKELLKECRETITDYNKWVMGAEPQDSKLINKIDEAIK